jgi:hypothetical protein
VVVLLLLAGAAGHAAVQGVSGATLQACCDACWQLIAAPHCGLLHIAHLWNRRQQQQQSIAAAAAQHDKSLAAEAQSVAQITVFTCCQRYSQAGPVHAAKS